MERNIIDNVFELCNKFIVDGKGQHVSINEYALKEVNVDVQKELKNREDNRMGFPTCIRIERRSTRDLNYEILAYELLGGAINYQYWYGKHNIRHNDVCANRMFELLWESFRSVEEHITFANSPYVCSLVGKNFIKKLSLERFPNLEKRIKHIKEIRRKIYPSGDIISSLSKRIINEKKPLGIDEFLKEIIVSYPGYAEDLFLKRAFLLVAMLYRRMRWFKDEIELLPIPADYQIPKMLNALRVIRYSSKLHAKIQNHELIPEGSLEECEIRAATILAIRKLSELSGFSMCDLDEYFWIRRKEVKIPFHLTITTNY